jgi:hypothetical protein
LRERRTGFYGRREGIPKTRGSILESPITISHSVGKRYNKIK